MDLGYVCVRVNFMFNTSFWFSPFEEYVNFIIQGQFFNQNFIIEGLISYQNFMVEGHNFRHNVG